MSVCEVCELNPLNEAYCVDCCKYKISGGKKIRKIKGSWAANAVIVVFALWCVTMVGVVYILLA